MHEKKTSILQIVREKKGNRVFNMKKKLLFYITSKNISSSKNPKQRFNYYNTTQAISKLFISILGSFLILACNNKPEASEHSEDIKGQEIENHLSTQVFDQLEPDEQFQLLINIIEKSILSDAEIDLETPIMRLENLLKSRTLAANQWLGKITELNQQLQDKGFMQQSNSLAKILIKNFETELQPREKVNSLNLLGQNFTFNKQRDSLAYIVNLLEKERTEQSSNHIELIYYTNKGNLSDLDGEYFMALVNYKKALNLTSSDDKYNRATLFQNLATMYLSMEYVEKAKECIDSSLAIIEDHTFPLHMYNTIATIQHRTNDFDNAQATFNQIIGIAQEENNPPLMAQSYANLANLKRKQGMFEEALEYTYLSDSLCSFLGIEVGQLINQINRAHIYFDQKLYGHAKNYMVQAQEKLYDFQNPKLNKDFYEIFYQIEDALGNIDLANKYYRLYNQNKENFLGDLPRSIIAEWELSQERSQRTEETAALNLTLERKKNENYFIALLSTVSLFLLSLISIFHIRKNQIKRKKTEIQALKWKHQLELQTKEMLTDSMKNMQMNWLKKELYAEIKELRNSLPKFHYALFQDTLTKLRPGAVSDYLEEFEMRFKGVHESFYEKLNQLCPDLTPTELRICAFMKLNITTKDIAVITNRTSGTIENVRVNIRKKLKLNKDINLQQYLMNL